MRTLSSRAYNGLIAQVTDEIFLALLTIEVDWRNDAGVVINSVYRVVAGASGNVISNGQTFTPYPFELVLPADSGEAIEQLQLTIDNVDISLTDGLRRAINPLRFKLEIVLAATPNTVEMVLDHMQGMQVEMTASSITATLNVSDIWDEKFPSVGETYDPKQCPGLF